MEERLAPAFVALDAASPCVPPAAVLAVADVEPDDSTLPVAASRAPVLPSFLCFGIVPFTSLLLNTTFLQLTTFCPFFVCL